jgi:hypothetical protein
MYINIAEPLLLYWPLYTDIALEVLLVICHLCAFQSTAFSRRNRKLCVTVNNPVFLLELLLVLYCILQFDHLNES